MPIRLEVATPEDADALAELRNQVPGGLTRLQGRGHWSSTVTRRGILHRMRSAKVFLVRRRGRVIVTLALTRTKPWAIDSSYFSPVRRALYLVDMAVIPELQGTGIGRGCLAQVEGIARSWPADAVRLDAYDSPAGAGPFYRRCGYREVGRAIYRDVPLVYYEVVL